MNKGKIIICGDFFFEIKFMETYTCILFKKKKKKNLFEKMIRKQVVGSESLKKKVVGSEIRLKKLGVFPCG